MDHDQKACRGCGELKHRDRFTRDPRNRDGLASWCKDCNAELARNRRRTIYADPKKYAELKQANNARFAGYRARTKAALAELAALKAQMAKPAVPIGAPAEIG